MDFKELFLTDKQTLALYLQAFATIAIGILAWTAARGQNIIAEKNERKNLFKLRYENIYLEATNLFLNCHNLTKEYIEIEREIKNKKQKLIKMTEVREKYNKTYGDFREKIYPNRFLIKNKDYDKLYSFCEDYLNHVSDYIFGRETYSFCLSTYFNEHYEKIPSILSPYLYHESESKIFFWIYKVKKYLKNNWNKFVNDYIPTYYELFTIILFMIGCTLWLISKIFVALKEAMKINVAKKQ